MTQPTEPTPAAPAVPAPAPQAGAIPPWGSDTDFNPEKAWALIQNLRGDNEKKNQRIAALEPHEKRIQEIEDAQKSEIEKAMGRAATAETEAAKKATEVLRLRTALKHNISDEDADLFLTGSTAEQLEQQAARLAALRQTQAPPATGGTRPVEALQPGASPTTPQISLDDQIAELMKDPRKNMRQLMALQNMKLAQIATERK